MQCIVRPQRGEKYPDADSSGHFEGVIRQVD